MDDIINTANELVFRAVNAIEEGLGNASAENLGFKLDPATAASLRTEEARRDALVTLKQNEIDSGIVKLESLLNATVDKDFDKLEIYTLRNILAVGHEEENLASWVRLDHYSGIEVANAENAPLPEDIALQRRKLNETAKLNAMLKAEEAKNAAILSQLSALISQEPKDSDNPATSLAFLNASAAAANTTELTQATQYSLNQLPALQQLLEKLKDAVQTLPNVRHSRYDDEDTAEGRRRKYLETQSRRALERRGIDTDTSASAGLTTGRKFARDELQGIEAVAKAIGSADATDARNKNQDEMVE